MGTKESPGTFDCYENAEYNEPMFILLARDRSAPALVEAWADRREKDILAGHKPSSDAAMVKEARECAKNMRLWREVSRAD